MIKNRFLEAATTKYLIVTVGLLLLLTIDSFALVLAFHLTDLDRMAKFVDATFKTMAVLIGVIWTLNRYYIGRADTIRLRVDSDVSVVNFPGSSTPDSNLALLVFRLDVMNIGTVLIPHYKQKLEIASVSPSLSGAVHKSLYHWPDSGTHDGGPIEPNAWAAINNAIAIPEDVRAVRFYLEVELSEDYTWTWHKTFDVSKGIAR